MKPVDKIDEMIDILTKASESNKKQKWEKKKELDSYLISVLTIFPLHQAASCTFFYWKSKNTSNYKKIRAIPNRSFPSF